MAFTIQAVADAIGATFAGDGHLSVVGPNEPAVASEDELAMAMAPKYAEDLGRGAAKAAVLWEGADWSAFGLKAAIFVPRPRPAMAAITQTFDVPRDLSEGVHPSAIVHPSASLGDDVRIGPFCVVGANTRIGQGARIHDHVSIEGRR